MKALGYAAVCYFLPLGPFVATVLVCEIVQFFRV
jgi:hypothetical protein